MTGREALKELARLERASITGPPPPFSADVDHVATVARLVDDMTAWDAAYKRERRRRAAERRGRLKVVGE